MERDPKTFNGVSQQASVSCLKKVYVLELRVQGLWLMILVSGWFHPHVSSLCALFCIAHVTEYIARDLSREPRPSLPKSCFKSASKP